MNTKNPTYQKKSKCISPNLTRVELLYALRYQTPCIFLVLATPQLGTYQQPYTHAWRTHAYDTVVVNIQNSQEVPQFFLKWGENCLIIDTKQTTNFQNRGVCPLNILYVIGTTQQTPTEIGLIVVGKMAAFTFYFLHNQKKTQYFVFLHKKKILVININHKIIFAKLGI